ncbi:hypothetical protein D0Z03_001253 [Geotrichum reessii]|nr:hypothetical protein D0Z03_001253 [Galactomyces reessii]
MVGVKASELRNKNKTQLEEQLAGLKEELSKLRVQQSSKSVKSTKISEVRKSIARILTVINLTQREQLREFYKNKKYIPKDLRVKQTRAIRRRLTVAQTQAKTLKQQKAEKAFPQRKYAIKA